MPLQSRCSRSNRPSCCNTLPVKRVGWVKLCLLKSTQMAVKHGWCDAAERLRASESFLETRNMVGMPQAPTAGKPARQRTGKNDHLIVQKSSRVEGRGEEMISDRTSAELAKILVLVSQTRLLASIVGARAPMFLLLLI